MLSYYCYCTLFALHSRKAILKLCFITLFCEIRNGTSNVRANIPFCRPYMLNRLGWFCANNFVFAKKICEIKDHAESDSVPTNTARSRIPS